METIPFLFMTDYKYLGTFHPDMTLPTCHLVLPGGLLLLHPWILLMEPHHSQGPPHPQALQAVHWVACNRTLVSTLGGPI